VCSSPQVCGRLRPYLGHPRSRHRPVGEASARVPDTHRRTLSTDPTVGVCFDADRLDLGRVGIEPDPELMSTEAGRKRTLLRAVDRGSTDGPHRGVRTVRVLAFGAPLGDRSRAAAPRDPARWRCATFVCRQEGPTPTGVTLTFHRAQSHASGEAGRRTSVPAWRPARSSLRSPKRFRPRRKPALPPSSE
jgi:hypothetical protein